MERTRGHNVAAYAIEALFTAVLVAAAGLYSVAFRYPSSPLSAFVADPTAARAVIAGLSGLTIVGVVYSPWGRHSGAQLNPALTLAFVRLGKVAPAVAAGYVAAQFAGAFLGVGILALVLRPALNDPAVHWYVTVPGMLGAGAAFAGETFIAAILITVVLRSMQSRRWRPYTGVCAAAVVALAVLFESPLSGAGLNPARCTATVAFAGVWTAFWIYLIAPPLGMLAGAELFARGGGSVPCAKLVHDHTGTCHFRDCRIAREANDPLVGRRTPALRRRRR